MKNPILLCLLSLSWLNAAAATLPNFVVIFTDDQGWGTTSVQYDPAIPESKSDFFRTPNIERLAKMGVRFTDGYASHPNCSPSRAALLTGRSPAALKFTDICNRNTGPLYEGNRMIPAQHIDALPADEITLPEILKQHQPHYKAAHFGKWHLGENGPEAHGFDAGDGPTGNGAGSRPRNLPDDPKLAFSITKRGNEWMEQQVKAGAPFYLQISHYATHLGCQSRPATREMFAQMPGGKRHQAVPFAAMLYDMDAAIGRTLDKIRELGIQDNTYIFYTTDNGTFPTADSANVNGPLRGSKATVWEGGIRVPFIVAGPGIKGDSVSRRTVVGYDIFPTICDILGIHDLPEKVEGGSFKHLLGAPEAAPVQRPHDFLVFHWPHYQHGKKSKPDTTIRQGDMKLHYFYETKQSMLFNLNTDLAEEKDLAAAMPEKASELRKTMVTYLKTVEANLPAENPDFDPANDPAIRKGKGRAESGQTQVKRDRKTPSPNFLIFMTDDQSYWHTSANGDPVVKTPNFDRVAKEGVSFTHCFANAPSCTPSRGACLTGRNVYELEETSVLQGAFPAKLKTFQELLWEAGYHCGYNGKCWGPGLWNATGRTFDPGGLPYQVNYPEEPDRGLSQKNYTEGFRRFLADRKEGQPFSFFAGVHEPHGPYKPGIGVENGLDPEKVNLPGFIPDTPGIRSHVCDYLYEIQWADRHLGEMLDILEESGELENTVVIVTSDNGMSFPGGKCNLYDQGSRVPFAVRYPVKIPAGRTVDDLITLADLHPTICNMAGVKPAAGISAKSMEDLLFSKESGRLDPGRKFVVTAFEVHTLPYPMRALRDERYLYIRNYEPERAKVPQVWKAPTSPSSERPGKGMQMGHWGYLTRFREEADLRPIAKRCFGIRPAEEIYDLNNDPFALVNLADAPDMKKLKESMGSQLSAHLKATGDPRHTNKPVKFQEYPLYVSPSFMKENPELVKKLRSEQKKLLQAMAESRGIMDYK